MINSRGWGLLCLFLLHATRWPNGEEPILAAVVEVLGLGAAEIAALRPGPVVVAVGAEAEALSGTGA
jgi:hypothetical protein